MIVRGQHEPIFLHGNLDRQRPTMRQRGARPSAHKPIEPGICRAAAAAAISDEATPFLWKKINR